MVKRDRLTYISSSIAYLRDVEYIMFLKRSMVAVLQLYVLLTGQYRKASQSGDKVDE